MARVTPAARFGLTPDTTIWGWLAPPPLQTQGAPLLFSFLIGYS